MIEYKGTLVGKRIFTHTETKKCRFEKLIKEYSQFDKINLLREFSDFSTELFKTKGKHINISGIPITIDFINYCILLSIKYCTGSITTISQSDINFLFKISLPWYDNELNFDKDNPHEFLIKLAYRQFVYQESETIITRSIYIYNFLWEQKYNSSFNIKDAFLKMYGITYDKFLFYGMALSGSKDSYFYTNAYRQNFSQRIAIDFQDDDFEKFISIVSINENDFVNYKGSLLNPIFKYPILTTNFYPPNSKEPVCLILSKACLYNKLVYGVYYDLLEKNIKENGKNDFKTIFGLVFQEYIGVLLKAHFKKWRVTPEIYYQKDKNRVATVDWFVQRGCNLILIEVKQSSIYLSAKNEGNIDELKKGIEQNIIKAINQLEKTEKDILSKKYQELRQFDKIKNIQKLIVVFDPLYFGNLIVNFLFDDILINKKTHIINLESFESLLEVQKKSENLFYVLESKMNMETINMDFTEFLYNKYKYYHSSNKFLLKHFNKMLNDWHIKKVDKKSLEDKK
jgi:hypothetical protein